jgi:hypothetical protein
MQNTTFFSLFLLLLSACGNPKAEKQTNTAPTKSLEMCMDTLDNQQAWQYFTKGYRDTCYVNGQHFAVRLQDSINGTALLEKKINNVWQLIDSFNYGQYGYNFTTDYNHDGYADFVENQKWNDNVFLYDAHNQTFVHTGDFYTGSKDSSVLINAERQLYADRWSYKFENGWSYLYTLKDLKRTNIAQMEYISQNKNGEIIENAKKRTIDVLKINPDGSSSKPLETLQNPKGFEEYNYPYSDYWRKNWQKLVK